MSGINKIFYDGPEAVKHYRALRSEQKPSTMVATVMVRFMATNTKSRDTVIDFVREIFDGIDVLYGADAYQTLMAFYDRAAEKPGRIDDILERCVIMNTYFKHYFYPDGDIGGFCIYYGVHSDSDKLTSLAFSNSYDAMDDFLDINENVRASSKAKDGKKLRCVGRDTAGEKVYDYGVVNPELAKALEKIAGPFRG